MDLDDFKYLWSFDVSTTVWCVKHQMFLRRGGPTRFTSLPFGHDVTVKLNPEDCFKCKDNIINKGICDPI